MLAAARLYVRFVRVSIREQMAHRASFVLESMGNLLVTGAEFFALAALFARFDAVNGWSLPEVALLYGLVSSSFAVGEGLFSGFDYFGDLLKSGELDRLLLRPRSLVLQVVGHRVALKNVGRLLQALAVFTWGLSVVSVPWSAPKVALVVCSFLGGVGLFFAIFMLQASLSFWTTESVEAMNTLTYGGVDTASFPLSLYPRWLHAFFIFVVPLGCVTYLPMLGVLDRAVPFSLPPITPWIAPLAAPGFVLISCAIFRAGVARYTSTGT